MDLEELKDGSIKDEEKATLLESSLSVSGSFRSGPAPVRTSLIKYATPHRIYVTFVRNSSEIKLR